MARHLRSQDAEEQITVCDDEATAPEHSISCAQSTEPVLESPPKKRHPNHHVGPIDLSYEEDSQRRCKSFFKRRKTIFDKANQLTSICGASVSIMLKSQAGHLYEYRSGEFQPDGVAGMPMISVQQGPTPRGRPRKTPAKSKNDESEQDEQAGTCSSSSACHQPIGKKTPCAVCKKRNTWLACQKPGCNFWAHARCLGFVALAPTDMSNVKFFCPKHIPAS
ncbi:uncharacterized protein LOC110989109 isoform X2 [Acanthaster planci]|nr:uncharacterized protein LOC110989109 isoform X2 [Acanthaster planci]XP_022108941.1 uncharacterized protein LOC110989109 isoform X2 [Acanthaster planci]XP_022108942.1 uncharacterized protein LOC110989109 isoform X2 [Acanthaster planci]XP_022108943.1 uncharacterized protein LOC110989109 isoform X2 [Acanthaster planci]